ncbi:MAG: DUF2145 domain-containing protein [Ideonella sp. MAG2]|nr:MAG: DUF2145 domain-containing protein [Ideonella sp. MAG2]
MRALAVLRHAAWAAAVCCALPAHAALRFCGLPPDRSVAQEERLLTLTAAVKAELQRVGAPVALVSRSGLNLARFGLRYTHAGWSLREGTDPPWAVRQLYFDCEEQTPRLFDQGLTGFVRGVDDPELAFISLVWLPQAPAQALAAAAQDKARALSLQQGRYSANAYAFSTRSQNCNQWALELLANAVAPAGREPPRAAAQAWLRQAGYQPSVVGVGAWWGVAALSPWLHDDEHPLLSPEHPRYSVSTPHSLEAFIHQQWPQAQRVELCVGASGVMVERGWQNLPATCEQRS